MNNTYERKFSMVKKRLILINTIILFVIVMVGCESNMSITNETYRIITIVESQGNVQVKRDGVGILQAYPQMKLLNNDKVTVDPNSYARLSLDDNKYVYVESNTIFLLKSSEINSSNTYIMLEKGKLIEEIEKEGYIK